eukprot:COSAG02_NODE_478_length_21511_cov_120.811087_1_plen_292_part_00
MVEHMNVRGIHHFTLEATTGARAAKFGDDSCHISTSFLLKAHYEPVGSRAATTASAYAAYAAGPAGAAAAVAPLHTPPGGRLVAKGLWTYHNSEMNSTGPTIEWIEVAQEWRSHGIGRLFYLKMEEFMCRAFRGLHGNDGLTNLDLHACHVTSEGAARFFLAVKFKDADGMLEELTKQLEGDFGECFADTVEGCKRRPVASGAMTTNDIAVALQQYNRNNGVNFAGAPVRGQHRKPCTDCGTKFHSFDAGYYYTDTLSPWGADKLCSGCMAERLGGYFADAPGAYGDEEDY